MSPSRIVSVVLTLLFVPSMAWAVPIGVVSFDTFIAGPGGVNAFNVANFTEAFSLPPDFPVADPLILSTATLEVTRQGGSVETIVLGSVGPGFVANPALQFPDSDAFSSATFTATLTDLRFTLADGSTFKAASSVLSVQLLPNTGLLLSPGDFAVVDVRPATVSEPGTLMLLGGSSLVSWRIRRRVRQS